MNPEDILNMDAQREYPKKFTFKTRSSFSHPPHFHESIEIVFVMDGIFKTACDGTEYKLPQEMCFYAALIRSTVRRILMVTNKKSPHLIDKHTSYLLSNGAIFLF